MTVVVCHPRNAVSAVKLGYPVQSRFPTEPGPVINWGRGDGPSLTQGVLNPPQVIAQTIDKPGFLRMMSGREGINVPTVLEEGMRLPIGRWVQRPNEHAEGNGFEVIDVTRGAPYEVNEGHHATKLITPANEYRVWFYGRDQFLTAKRIPRTSEGQQATDLCRSKWGYRFTDNYPQGIAMVKAMLEIVPINFGAVDMLWHTGERKWYILEVNSAPSLDHEEVLSFFKSNFNQWVNSQMPSRTAPQRVVTPPNPAPRPTAPVSNTIQVLSRDGSWVTLTGQFTISRG